MAIPRTDSTGPRPLASVEATRAITPLGDTRQESLERLVRLEVGKQFQAQILSRFNDGTFLVRIADTAARLALPAGGKVGDALALTLLSTEPRPAFSLDSQSPGSAGVGAGTRLAQALYLSGAQAGAGAAGLDAVATASAPASLSDTGRLIAELLTAAHEGGTASSLVGKVPLSNMPGAGAPQLASALHDTLAYSGLFYESHVAQWATGERPLTDLLKEPQAQGSTASAGAVPGGDVPPAVLEARRNLLDYFSTAAHAGADTSAGAAKTLDPAAAQLINLQLNALEQQRVTWHGELWPGQPMEWEVRREERDRSGAGSTDPAPEQWQSKVRFTLPSLGVVSATIHLSGERVQISVRTADDATAATLRRHGPRLSGALGAAGSVLENLTITRAVDTESDDGRT